MVEEKRWEGGRGRTDEDEERREGRKRRREQNRRREEYSIRYNMYNSI